MRDALRQAKATAPRRAANENLTAAEVETHRQTKLAAFARTRRIDCDCGAHELPIRFEALP